MEAHLNALAAALNHFNSCGSVVVRTRGYNVLYAKLWHTESVLASAIQESDSFNCVGEYYVKFNNKY